MIEFAVLVITGAVALSVTMLVQHHIVSKRRLGEAYQYAVYAAYAAEELFNEGNGDTKLRYAVDRILARFNLSEEDARMLVNAAVKGMRLTGVKTTPAPTGSAPSTLRSIS